MEGFPLTPPLRIKNPKVRRELSSTERGRESLRLSALNVSTFQWFVVLLAVVMSEEENHPLKYKSMSNACVNTTYGFAVRYCVPGGFELLTYRAVAGVEAYHRADFESRSFLGLAGSRGITLAMDCAAARFSRAPSTSRMCLGPAGNIGNVDYRNERLSIQNSALQRGPLTTRWIVRQAEKIYEKKIFLLTPVSPYGSSTLPEPNMW